MKSKFRSSKIDGKLASKSIYKTQTGFQRPRMRKDFKYFINNFIYCLQ